MERYEKLYNYLLKNRGRWITQKELCENLGYQYHDRNNDKAPMIREDMKLINEDTNLNLIVVCNKYCFKIGNKDETIAYRKYNAKYWLMSDPCSSIFFVINYDYQSYI